MIALIYSLLSTLFLGTFVITSLPLIQVATVHLRFQEELLSQVQQQINLEKRKQERLLAQRRTALKSVGIIDKIVVTQIQPLPTPSSETAISESYAVEPIGDGFYKMLNVPDEPMSTVEELNQAVSSFRVSQGKAPLEQDAYLCEFADRRAHEVADYFSHEQFSRHIEEGMANDWGFHHLGENIWQGKFMGVHIVEYGWAKSPGHYSALVGNWTQGCAGIYNDNAVYLFAR